MLLVVIVLVVAVAASAESDEDDEAVAVSDVSVVADDASARRCETGKCWKWHDDGDGDELIQPVLLYLACTM